MSNFYLLQATPAPTEMWLLCAVAGATIVYAVFLRPMRRQKKDPLAKMPGQSLSSLSRQREVERQMETLLVELSEMARQITAQLDTRAAKLEALIEEADEKIAAMQGLHQPPEDPGAAAGVSMPQAQQKPAVEQDERHVAIYDLADAGLSAAQIAQRLDRPSGEIELILALRPGN
jgi:L-lactate utilization protein LutC